MHTQHFTKKGTLLGYYALQIVSELLGHSNMKTTQEHYGKIVQRKISLEIGKLINNTGAVNLE